MIMKKPIIRFVLPIILVFVCVKCVNNNEILLKIDSGKKNINLDNTLMDISFSIQNDKEPIDLYNLNVVGLNDTFRNDYITGIYIFLLDKENRYVTTFPQCFGHSEFADFDIESVVIGKDFDTSYNNGYWNNFKTMGDSTLKEYSKEYSNSKISLKTSEIYNDTIRIDLFNFDIKKGVYYIQMIYIGDEEQVVKILDSIEQKPTLKFFSGKLVSNKLKLEVK